MGKMSSGERGRSITVVCDMNSAGNYIPPLFIFACVNILDVLMINAPHGSGCPGTKNGWSDKTILINVSTVLPITVLKISIFGF